MQKSWLKPHSRTGRSCPYFERLTKHIYSHILTTHIYHLHWLLHNSANRVVAGCSLGHHIASSLDPQLCCYSRLPLTWSVQRWFVETDPPHRQLMELGMCCSIWLELQALSQHTYLSVPSTNPNESAVTFTAIDSYNHNLFLSACY